MIKKIILVFALLFNAASSADEGIVTNPTLSKDNPIQLTSKNAYGEWQTIILDQNGNWQLSETHSQSTGKP